MCFWECCVMTLTDLSGHYMLSTIKTPQSHWYQFLCLLQLSEITFTVFEFLFTVTSAWKQLFRALLLLCVLFEINGQHALMLCGDSHIITAQEAELTKIARKDVAWPMLCWLLLALSMYYICSHAGLHYSTFSLAHKTSRHVVSVSL